MRICFVNILYSKKNERGGLGAHIADLSLELSRCGHEVTVITSGHESAHHDNGVEVVSLGEVHRYSRPLQLLNPVYPIRRLIYMLRMTGYVRRSNFDIVEAAEGGFEQLFLVFFRKSPIVTKLHGNFKSIYSKKTLLAYFMEKLESLVVNASDGVYSSTHAYARVISQDYKIPTDRIEIIPCGIDVSRLRSLTRLDLEQQYPIIKGKKLVFLSVGGSPGRKGAWLLLEVAARIKQDNILFILSCSDQQLFKGTKIPENLVILPNLDRGEFYNWMSRSDIVVFPSQFESLSISVREAMLFKKTIILSSHVPLEGLDSDYPRYYLLQELDPALLADTILKITNGERSFPEVGGEFHQQLSDKYDIRRVAEVTLDFYKETAKKFNHGSGA